MSANYFFNVFNIFIAASNIFPKFTKHPVSVYSNSTGGSLKIHGCTYESFFPLNKNDEVFYLANGVTKYITQFRLDLDTENRFDRKDRFEIEHDLERNDHSTKTFATKSSYHFIPYTKEETSVEDQGFYQCAIAMHDPVTQTILSNTADVQFSGVYLFLFKDSVETFIHVLESKTGFNLSHVKVTEQIIENI